MAATAVQSLVEPRVFPQITNETLDLMRAQQRQILTQGQDRRPAAELPANLKRYVFRSKPDTYRHIVHQIDVRPESDANDTSAEGAKRRFILNSWNRRHKADPEGEAARLQAIAEAAGDKLISFTQIRGHQECWFQTDDPQLAAYVRDLIAKGVGEFAQVVETDGTARIIAGDKAFPNSELGRKAAWEYAQSTGVTDLKVVSEAA